MYNTAGPVAADDLHRQVVQLSDKLRAAQLQAMLTIIQLRLPGHTVLDQGIRLEINSGGLVYHIDRDGAVELTHVCTDCVDSSDDLHDLFVVARDIETALDDQTIKLIVKYLRTGR